MPDGRQQVIQLAWIADHRIVERLPNFGRADQRSSLPGKDENDSRLARDFEDVSLRTRTINDQMAAAHQIEAVRRANPALLEQALRPRPADVDQAFVAD